MMFLGPVILLVHLLGPFVASEFTAIVETTSGPVQGVIEERTGSEKSQFANKQYAAFRGIRYAQAPIGNQRFKPPRRADYSTELHIGNAEANVCPQYGLHSNVIGDEDCLFLNVLTPVTKLDTEPEELKPVMVWIHDGNFVRGSGRTDLTNPDLLIDKNVVFVSMNYRLGALGFLSLDRPEASGNQGLKDQNLALEWVRANIKKFGGDPGKVTIFGKGAGAASVGFHVLSKASKGLFHRAISMSGTLLSPYSFMSRSEAVQRGASFVKLIKGSALGLLGRLTQSDLDVIRNVPLELLLEKTARINPDTPFLPTVEHPNKAEYSFLSAEPIAIYESGDFNKVPHIIGITKADNFPDIRYMEKFVRSVIEHYSESLSMGSQERKKFIHKEFFNQAKYFGIIVDIRNKRTTELGLAKDDILFSYPVAETRRLLVKNNGEHPIYHYRMDFPIDSSSQDLESKRNVYLKDSMYTRDRDSIFLTPENYGLGPNDPFRITMDKVSTMWTNFAKHGNPTPAEIDRNLGDLVWPETKGSGEALLIGDEITIVPGSSLTMITTIKKRSKTFSAFLYS